MNIRSVGKSIVPLTLALACSQAMAVSLNPRGTGQVLLYPYYTVNGGNQTLLLVGNSTDHAKAVRVRFSEGRNGRTVLSFNLYLSPYDIWTAGIFSQDATGPANLVTNDTSCTFPEIKTNTSLPALPDGRRYVAFRNIAYTGSGDDAGPNDLSRTREGYVEIIEMGSVVRASLTDNAVIHRLQGSQSIPFNCGYVTNGWAPGGFWTTNATTDLHNPTGGLFGNISLVNAAAGTMLTFNADALDEFRQDPSDSPRGSTSSVVLNSTAADPRPSLADALTDPARNLASATVFVDGQLVRADYPANTQGIDAVTAVLMANTLSNDYIVDATAGANSEWILSFPTRRFYTDAAIAGGTALAPFLGIYPNSGDETLACTGVGIKIYSREELTVADSCFIGVPPPGCPSQVNLCYSTQTIPFNQRDGQSPTNASWLGSNLAVEMSPKPIDIGFLHGWTQLNLADGPEYSAQAPYRMRPAQDGTVFEGLPAIGFLGTNYINNNVMAGVLANYSGAFSYRSTAKCTRSGASCP